MGGGLTKNTSGRSTENVELMRHLHTGRELGLQGINGGKLTAKQRRETSGREGGFVLVSLFIQLPSVVTGVMPSPWS